MVPLSVVAMHQPRLVKDTNRNISISENYDDMVVITVCETRVALQSRLQVAASIPILGVSCIPNCVGTKDCQLAAVLDDAADLVHLVLKRMPTK